MLLLLMVSLFLAAAGDAPTAAAQPVLLLLLLLLAVAAAAAASNATAVAAAAAVVAATAAAADAAAATAAAASVADSAAVLPLPLLLWYPCLALAILQSYRCYMLRKLTFVAARLMLHANVSCSCLNTAHSAGHDRDSGSSAPCIPRHRHMLLGPPYWFHYVLIAYLDTLGNGQGRDTGQLQDNSQGPENVLRHGAAAQPLTASALYFC
jgi:hypothetical protein